MSKLQINILIVAIIGLVIFAAVGYLNSGYFHRKVANVAGYATRCIDGVKYIEFAQGVSVKYNKDTGQIETCK